MTSSTKDPESILKYIFKFEAEGTYGNRRMTLNVSRNMNNYLFRIAYASTTISAQIKGCPEDVKW